MLSGNYATQCASAAHENLKKPIENSSLGGSVDTCMDDTRQREQDGRRRSRASIASMKNASTAFKPLRRFVMHARAGARKHASLA
jgi:hypothetical protein